MATTTKRSLALGIDLDGCVYDFVDAMRRTVAARTGTDPSTLKDACCWEFFSHCWGLTLEQFLDHNAHGVDNGTIFGTGDPLPGAVETLHALHAEGHQLHIITDRGGVGTRAIAEASTRAWLDQHGVPYASLTFSADKTVKRTDLFIDDRDKNYAALHAAQQNPVLFTRPWNTHVPDATRVASWREFHALVNQTAAQQAA